MPFRAVTLHSFHGEDLSLREISKKTGINYWTIVKRAQRGKSLDGSGRPEKKRPLALTGDRERDLQMIVGEMHRRLIKRR